MRMNYKLLGLMVGAMAVFALLAVDAKAYFMDGNMLWDSCKSSRAHALGYVVGVLDFMTEMAPEVNQCLPSNATSGQLTDIVCQALETTPQVRHMSASQISVAAISNALAC